MAKKINEINHNFKYIPKSSKLLKKIEVNTTHGNNSKILKYLKNFNFTDFDKALFKTIKWYIDKNIYKIT